MNMNMNVIRPKRPERYSQIGMVINQPIHPVDMTSIMTRDVVRAM